MKDIQLYEQILGLTVPWRVDEVKLKPKEQEIEVRVSYADTTWGCAWMKKGWGMGTVT
jgi:hypothetical protein